MLRLFSEHLHDADVFHPLPLNYTLNMFRFRNPQAVIPKLSKALAALNLLVDCKNRRLLMASDEVSCPGRVMKSDAVMYCASSCSRTLTRTVAFPAEVKPGLAQPQEQGLQKRRRREHADE